MCLQHRATCEIARQPKPRKTLDIAIFVKTKIECPIDQ